MATTKARTTTYIDLDLDFTRNPATNDVSFKKDEEAIKRSVRNLVLTNFGERKFHPEIGSDAYSYLFENMSPLTAHNAYEVSVAFRINAIQKTVSISLFLERLN